ncbi:MAG: SurA N-terminal domain-containing protein [Candidatus Lambdaproteobacteria bacterium]|nr:SurA N-terminal domain-containing protein [Candidatus Lambdaproteobacteria bacterium]
MAVALLALLVAGCFGNRREISGGDSRRSIASVNNEQISLEDFQNEYRRALENWERFVTNDSTKRADLGRIVLERMIEQKLLDQEVRRRGIKLDEDAFRAGLLREVGPQETSRLTASSDKSALPEKSWVLEMRRRALHEKLVRQEVVAKLHITPRDVRTYYQEHRDEFVQPEQVRVRHIAVGNQAVYNRVVRLLEQNVDFVKLVREFSITPDRLHDGDLGFVERGVLPEAFDLTIFKMTVIGGLNPLGKPVQTEMGYHIFRLEDRKPQAVQGFEEATPRIREQLVDEQRPKAYAAWLGRLRDAATIYIDYKLLTSETG